MLVDPLPEFSDRAANIAGSTASGEQLYRQLAPCLHGQCLPVCGNCSREFVGSLENFAFEEVTYRRGTDTVTDKHVFHRATVAETSRQMEIATGKARLSIPADTMHSFASSNNKIAWELCLHGEIEGWPDVKLEFGLNIEPLPLTGGRA